MASERVDRRPRVHMKVDSSYNKVSSALGELRA
jgi:hypothetical protein